jgi:type II secretory pathway component PulJ
MKHLRPSAPGRRPPAAGFTLVELLITIALVIMLVAGINAVFRATTQTIGTGTAIAEAVRLQRGLERTLSSDLERMVPLSREMPCLLIYSQAQPAFRDRPEMNQDADYSINGSPTQREAALRTMDLNADGAEAPGEILSPVIYNDRNHRLDRLAFFVRDLNNPYTRQTGNQNPLLYNQVPHPLITSESSSEAWIWYGHLRLPRHPPKQGNVQYSDPSPNLYASGGDYFDPGQENPSLNEENFFSNDWAFGRVAMILKPDAVGERITYVITQTSRSPRLGPLSKGSPAGDGQSAPQDPIYGVSWLLEHSRYDIAQDTIPAYRNWLMTAIPAFTNADLVGAFDYRFHCKPWTVRGMANPNASLDNWDRLTRETALTVPFFQRGVSQFIVEFAGDYLTQQPMLLPTANGVGAANSNAGRAIDVNGDGFFNDPDGEIDFVVSNGVKRIRWYGMPRDIDVSDAPIGHPVGVPYIRRMGSGPGMAAREIVDVVPVSDLVRRADGTPPSPWFEIFRQYDPVTKALGAFIPANPAAPDYSATVPDTFCTYACAWTPADLVAGRGPKMFRIVMTQSDPNGRMPEGQSVEYVFTLPQ